MSETAQNRVVGLLGVGFDHQDRHIRITEAENYKVIMGSGESHRALQDVCSRIEKHIRESGRQMSDYTPEEFMELMREIA